MAMKLPDIFFKSTFQAATGLAIGSGLAYGLNERMQRFNLAGDMPIAMMFQNHASSVAGTACVTALAMQQLDLCMKTWTDNAKLAFATATAVTANTAIEMTLFNTGTIDAGDLVGGAGGAVIACAVIAAYQKKFGSHAERAHSALK